MSPAMNHRYRIEGDFLGWCDFLGREGHMCFVHLKHGNDGAHSHYHQHAGINRDSSAAR